MAPRARARGRKRRLSRMDAAVDAMLPYGFSEELVQRTVDDLLQVYDAGDEGWPFIEADAYSVLLETILGEQPETQQQEDNHDICGQGPPENLFMDGPSRDGVGEHDMSFSAESSNRAAVEPICPEIVNTAAQTGGGDEDYHLQEDIGLNQSWSEEEELINGPAPKADSCSSQVISSSTVDGVPTRRRRRYYGWMSDGEEEPEFVYLTPASQPCI